MGGNKVENKIYKSIEYKFKDQRLFEDYYSLYSIGREYWAEPDTYYQDCMIAPERQCVFQYTVSGEGVLICDRKKYRMEPGMAFLIERPGRYQYYRAKNASHWEIKFISFNLASLKIWRDITEQFGRVVKIPKGAPVIQCWDEIYEIALKNELNSFFAASSYAYMFIMKLYETLLQEPKLRSGSDIVQRCVSIIQMNYKEDLNLDYLANACGVSVPYLCKLFRQAMQTSPIRYLNQHRIDIARSLLLRSNLKVEDVAKSCGYLDVNYFSRAFRTATGQTPRAYRNMESHHVIENQKTSLQITPEGILKKDDS